MSSFLAFSVDCSTEHQQTLVHDFTYSLFKHICKSNYHLLLLIASFQHTMKGGHLVFGLETCNHYYHYHCYYYYYY
jgi:hypothetical protein